MYAQLGSLLFENLTGFQSYNRQGAAVYAEHTLIEGKPRLQKTGLSLDEITIAMRLHCSFCDPGAVLEQLSDARDNGEVLPLLWGNGVKAGTFVITEIGEQIEEQDTNGEVFSYLINCSLKEYVVKDKLQHIQADNRKKATATGNKKPVVQKKKNPSTCPQTITNIVAKIDNHGRAISAIVLEKGGGATSLQRSKILHHLSAMRLLDEDLLARCNNPASCASTLPDLKYRAEQLLIGINNFNKAAADNTPAQYPAQNQILAALVRRLKEAARTLTNQAITRK